jgi:hypothetical protein
MGFVEYVSSATVAGQLKELQQARLLLFPNQISEGIELNEHCPTNVQQWATQWME